MQASATNDQNPLVPRERIDFAAGHAARERAEKGGTKLQGHEAFLKNLEGSGTGIVVTLIGGDKVSGQIKASDRSTISIKQAVNDKGAYLTRVLFKHAIAEFQPMISLAPSSGVH